MTPSVLPAVGMLIFTALCAGAAAAIAAISNFYTTLSLYATGVFLTFFLVIMMRVRAYQLRKSALVYSDYRPSSVPIGFTRLGMLSLLAYAGLSVYPLLVTLAAIKSKNDAETPAPSSSSSALSFFAPTLSKLESELLLPMPRGHIISIVLAATQVALPPLCFALIFSLPLPELPPDRQPQRYPPAQASGAASAAGGAAAGSSAYASGAARNTEYIVVTERHSMMGDGMEMSDTNAAAGMRARAPYTQHPQMANEVSHIDGMHLNGAYIGQTPVPMIPQSPFLSQPNTESGSAAAAAYGPGGRSQYPGQNSYQPQYAGGNTVPYNGTASYIGGGGYPQQYQPTNNSAYPAPPHAQMAASNADNRSQQSGFFGAPYNQPPQMVPRMPPGYPKTNQNNESQ